MSVLLTAEEIDVTVGGCRVCRRLSLQIRPGESWALLGANGSGKTTLLHTLAGLRPLAAGALRIGDASLADLGPRERARRIAVLLQHSSRGFGARVIETVLTGRHPHLAPLAWEDASDLAIAQAAIAELGLAKLSERPLTTLSGGELRRVEIARLLAQQAPLNLLDEPLNHLDLAHQATCLQVLRRHCVDAAHALLMVMHDLNLAYQACDHWLLLFGDGDWLAGTRDDVADPALLRRAFGPHLAVVDGAGGPAFLTRLQSGE